MEAVDHVSTQVQKRNAPSWYVYVKIVFFGVEMAEEFVKDQLSKHSVVVFSKSYCPYCKMANSILSDTGAKFEIIQLENRGNF